MSASALIRNARPDIVDQFGRTVASGWGAADTGQAWIMGSGGTEYNVTGGVGVMDFGGVATRITRLAQFNADSDVSVDVALAATPTGSNVDISLVARRSASATTDYRVTVNFTPAGNISATLLRFVSGAATNLGTVLASTSYTPGSMYRVRLRCVGSTIQGKAWMVGDSEPAWTSVVDTSTPSGEQFMLATVPQPGNTTTDARALFDNFSCRALYPNVRDSFTRTVPAGGWGVADSGHGWLLSGTASDFSVSGGLGRIAPGSANQSRSATTLFSHMDVDQAIDIGAAQVQTGDSASGYMWARVNSAGNSGYRVAATFLTNGSLVFDLHKVVSGSITSLASVFATLSYTANEMFRVRLQCVGSTIRAKTWPAVDPEPSSWTVSVTDSDVTSGVASVCQVFRRSSSTSVDPTILFDNFFVRPLRPAIHDSFERTVASGWGELTSGQAWINSDTSQSSVGSGYGVHNSVASNSITSSIPSPAADVEVRGTVVLPSTPVGSTLSAAIEARAAQSAPGGTRYRVIADFSTGGDVTVALQYSTGPSTLATLIPSAAYTPGTPLHMRLRCVGSKIMGKAWVQGSAEPAWSEASDTNLVAAGFIRFGTFNTGTNTATDPTIRFDDFQVIDLSRPLRLDTGATSIDPSRLVAV